MLSIRLAGRRMAGLLFGLLPGMMAVCLFDTAAHIVEEFPQLLYLLMPFFLLPAA